MGLHNYTKMREITDLELWKEANDVITCSECHCDTFEVRQGSYITIVKCTDCGNIEVIHEG